MTTIHGLCWRLACAAVLLTSGVNAADQGAAPPEDRFAAVRTLIGTWEGTTEGQPRVGRVTRQYAAVLRDQFIEVRSTSTYAPQAANPKGEIHEEIGFISFDRGQKRLRLRQFHVEGFVIQYVQEERLETRALSFTSDTIENGPAGWRARETYVLHGRDEFEEVFELARDGRPFEVYSRSRLKRVK